jgi:hypothetical protein
MDAGSAGAMRGLFLDAQLHRARMPRVPGLRVIEDCNADVYLAEMRLNQFPDFAAHRSDIGIDAISSEDRFNCHLWLAGRLKMYQQA